MAFYVDHLISIHRHVYKPTSVILLKLFEKNSFWLKMINNLMNIKMY